MTRSGMIRVGIDVGGTNTDAVLIQGGTVRHAVKTATTADVMGGILATLRRLLDESGTAGDAVGAVMIGTTHFTNGVQRRGLARTAGIRISLPAARTLPASSTGRPICGRWSPPQPRVRGGFEVDGQPIAPFDADAVRAAARAIRADGAMAVAVTGAFAR
jgi:N-methylhydantoinase A/oxoprolinase/acetone carboxylase beta subunit